MPLTEIEDHIRQIESRIEDRTRGYHNEVIYDIAADGLMFLKARAHYALSAQRETVSPKRRKRDDKGQLTVSDEGFEGWIRRTFCQIAFASEAEAERFFAAKKRSIYNYMKLAANNGLTSDHSLGDVENLRSTAALHDRKPTEFYKGKLALEDSAGAENATPPAPTVNIVADTQRDLFASLDSALTLRDEMSADVYEAVHTRLHATLEKLTGARWIMTNESPSADASLHGELEGTR